MAAGAGEPIAHNGRNTAPITGHAHVCAGDVVCVLNVSFWGEDGEDCGGGVLGVRDLQERIGPVRVFACFARFAHVEIPTDGVFVADTGEVSLVGGWVGGWVGRWVG